MPASGTMISLMTGRSRHDLASWPEAIDAERHLDGFGEMIAAIANLDIVESLREQLARPSPSAVG